MEGFKKFGGESIDDLGQYVLGYMRKHKDVSIFVGCDSKEHRRHTQYAVTVCLYHKGKGAHVIFRRESEKHERTARMKAEAVGERLWGEVERAKAVADYFENVLSCCVTRKSAAEIAKLGFDPTQNKIVEIHVDFNPNPNTPIVASKRKRKRRSIKRMTDNKSNQVYSAGIGYLIGNGYRVKGKPDAFAASSAADLICRK